MRKYFLFFIFLYLISASLVQAKSITTTGFIPGQIWYSEDTINEGDTVKIYTAIWNNSESPLSAKVEFYDQNVILGTRDVVVPALQFQDVSVSWKVTSGDHLISAKITSPSTTISGKKEAISVNNVLTISDHKFIPVLINTVSGSPATSSEIIQSQIGKATASLDNILPTSVSGSLAKNVGVVDNFRSNTLNDILAGKATAEKKLKELNKADNNSKGSSTTTNSKVSTGKVAGAESNTIDSATEKPITYIKLFFLSLLSFVFGSKIIFYSLIVLILFFVFRGIYRKIRNR